MNAPAAAAGVSEPDDHDFQALARMHASVRRWNAVSGPLVTAFRDPAVTAEDFVRRATPAVVELKRLAVAINVNFLGMHDSGMAAALLPIGTAYRTEAEDFGLLVEAAGRGDQSAQTSIADRLTAEGQQKSKDTLALVAYIRGKYGAAAADAFTSAPG